MDEAKDREGCSLDESSPRPPAPDSCRGTQTAVDGKRSNRRGGSLEMDANRILIDTAAPFESVKAAVNMFGGTVDWKAQRILSKERAKSAEQELENAKEELHLYQRRSEAALDEKETALLELEATKKLVEELRLHLEKARTEAAQAQQDSELAQLRVREMEQGISGEASLAAKAQVKIATTRYLEAEDELISVKAELGDLQRRHEVLVQEREVASKKAEEAGLASKEAEKKAEKLTMELVAVKEALELAQASHLEAEELNLNAATASAQEALNWERHVKDSEEELQSLEEQLCAANDLKLKLDGETSLLSTLKAELAAYAPNKEPETPTGEKAKLASARNELEEIKASIEKAMDEVNCLRISASSLKSELETEKESLASLKLKEEMSTITIFPLHAELKTNQSELEAVQAKEKTFREEMAHIPKDLKEKAGEAEQAKSNSQSARRELTKAKETAELAKASATAMELRLQAVIREIEAAKASEKLALETMKAMQDSEEAAEDDGTTSSPKAVAVPMEEYLALSRKAAETESLAEARVIAAVEQIKDAKKKESLKREELAAACKEIKECKEALRDATEKAEMAAEGKLKAEQELRDWRSENEQRRKATHATNDQAKSTRFYWKSFDENRDARGHNSATVTRVNSLPYPNLYSSSSEGGAPSELRLRRKKSLFPRIVMFLAKRKAQSLK